MGDMVAGLGVPDVKSLAANDAVLTCGGADVTAAEAGGGRGPAAVGGEGALPPPLFHASMVKRLPPDLGASSSAGEGATGEAECAVGG